MTYSVFKSKNLNSFAQMSVTLLSCRAQRDILYFLNRILLPLLLLLLSACRPPAPMPFGLCLSFDDRSVQEWYALDTLLRRYGAVATFFVTQFDSLDAEEVDMLLRLQARGNEIGCHGARHLLAEPFVKERGWQAYLEADVFPALKAMEAAGLRVRSFAWPYGDGFRWGELKLRRHFIATRAVAPLHPRKGLNGTEAVFFRPGKGKRLHSASFDRNGGTDPDALREGLPLAKKRGEVLMHCNHTTNRLY